MVEFGKVPDKISAAVRKFIENTASLDGNSKKIDSQKEYDKLGEYLAGNKDNMNVHEQKFIQGFMIEYENDQKKLAAKKAAEDVENNVTESTKEAVKKIGKSMGDKKKIDTDAEAAALFAMLRNTKGDLNRADIDYIKNILIESGYGSLLEEKTEENNKPEMDNKDTGESAVTVTGSSDEEISQVRIGALPFATIPEQPVESSNPKPAPLKPSKPKTKPSRPKTKPAPDTAPTRPQEPNEPPKTKAPTQPSAPAKPKAQTPVKPTKYQISEKAKAHGRARAKAVLDEVNSRYADNERIKENLKNVATTSAFSFVGDMIQQGGGVAKTVFSVTDPFNKLNCKDMLHVMQALQTFAGGQLKLQDTQAYKNMTVQINHIEAMGERNPNDEDINNIDKAFKQLYDEINRHVQ